MRYSQQVYPTAQVESCGKVEATALDAYGGPYTGAVHY